MENENKIEPMTKSKKKYKGMFIMSIGLLFSASGTILVTMKDFGKLPLTISILGIIIIIFGFFKMLKENGKI